MDSSTDEEQSLTEPSSTTHGRNLTSPPILIRVKKETKFGLPPKTLKHEDAETYRRWSCIKATKENKSFKTRRNTTNSLADFIKRKLDGQDICTIDMDTLAVWLIQWSEPRGKCTYADDSKGISPQSAIIYFNMFKRVLLKDFSYDLLTIHPEMYHFPAKWQETITREKLYVRKQAGYFSREDVKQYITLFESFRENGNEKQQYFARMGMVILPIAILFAGCRLGELLSARIEQVQFVTVRGKVAVAIMSTGTKSDMANQRSSPIIFGQLDDVFCCPAKRFVHWIGFRKWQIQSQKLQGPKGALIFPTFKDENLKLPTAIFTREIRDLERKAFPDKIPRFKAHSGRFTITTLALFGKDEKDQPLISPLLLEHQLHWVRNTSTLSNYLGHNASFVKGGFYSQIDKIRNSGTDAKIDEKSITSFNNKEVNIEQFSNWYHQAKQ